MKRKYSLVILRYLVNKHHVSTRDFTIAREVVTRSKNMCWPRDQINLAIGDALKIHQHNKDTYCRVMGGMR